MLNKDNRLTKDKEFDYVFRRGQSSFNKMAGVKAVPNGLGRNRFGILVGAKVSKKAVARNKIKRQIRAVINQRASQMKQGYDCVIICLPAIIGKDYQEIERSVNALFQKLGMFKGGDREPKTMNSQ